MSELSRLLLVLAVACATASMQSCGGDLDPYEPCDLPGPFDAGFWGDGDMDTDIDSDVDSDSDSDSDADSDSDSDADADSDGDSDGDSGLDSGFDAG